MTNLHIDIETYSPIDLKTCGVYRYAEEAEILLISYAFDDGPVQMHDCTAFDGLPADLLNGLTDPAVMKWAHNANFERVLITSCLGIPCPPASWRCTMVWGRSLGLPPALANMAEELKLPHQKNPDGKGLIKRFSRPVKPTKGHPGVRWLPSEDPAGWEAFKRYCIDDTETERAIERKLDRLGLHWKASEWKLWALDQKINDRGVQVDLELVDAAMTMRATRNEALIKKAQQITGLDKPTSVAQLKKWLLDAEGMEVESLAKDSVSELMDTVGPEAKLVLQIRQETGKASVGKFAAIQRAACKKGRIHGMFEFYGARTGRWAGRLAQLHNLPGNTLQLHEIESAISMVKGDKADELQALYGNVGALLSELVRPALLPANGQFLVVDLSAIEARVLSWGAGEDWRMSVFRGDGKIYEASAARVFKVPLDTLIKGHPNYALRQKAKVLELACGFQGSVNALINMGALNSGLTEAELKPLVDDWRAANPNIRAMWRDMEDKAREAIFNWNMREDPKRRALARRDKRALYSFIVEKNCLFMTLPSGRRLAYLHPRITATNLELGEKGGEIEFDGVDALTHKFGPLRTYGGKLVENWTQAVARDLLAEAMTRIEASGHEIVAHVHDEVVIDAPTGVHVDDLIALMIQPVHWAPGLPLAAAGFATKFYRKD